MRFNTENSKIMHGFALLDDEQQPIALGDILSLNVPLSKINISGVPQIKITEQDVNFLYNPSIGKDVIYYCCVENLPKTKTGKNPKYPQCLHFNSGRNPADVGFVQIASSAWQSTPKDDIFGHIYYLPDGSIGRAEIVCWRNSCCYSIKCTIKNGKFKVTSIDKTSISGDYERTKIYRD